MLLSRLDMAAANTPAISRPVIPGGSWVMMNHGNIASAFSMVALSSVGSPVDVLVFRDGHEVTLSVTVIDRPPGSY